MVPSLAREAVFERCIAVLPKSFSAFFSVRKAVGSFASLRPFLRSHKVGRGL